MSRSPAAGRIANPHLGRVIHFVRIGNGAALPVTEVTGKTRHCNELRGCDYKETGNRYHAPFCSDPYGCGYSTRKAHDDAEREHHSLGEIGEADNCPKPQ